MRETDATGPSRAIRTAAVVSLVAELLLVGTGAAVRLTDSGLGCPTWPRCTADTLVTTPAMGIHGIVEFGNRLLTVGIVLVALATAIVAVLEVVRRRPRRWDLLGLAVAQLLSIPVQAVLGGITVLTRLNPWAVGAHLAFSLLLVAAMTALVHRSRSPAGPRRRSVPGAYAATVALAVAAGAAVLVLGIVTTGSGPHAGDAHSARNGLPQWLLQDVHGITAFTLFGLTVALLAAAVSRVRRALRAALALTAVEAAQIVVGVAQARLGLPPELVIVHVLLAGCLAAALTALVLSTRGAVDPARIEPGPQRRTAGSSGSIATARNRMER